MYEIFAMAIKDIRLMLRDRAGFFFTFFFPLIVAVFFGAIFSGSNSSSQSMSILVVDEDSSIESREFINLLAASDELRVQMAGREEATEQVRLGSAIAYVALTPGFGEARKNLFWGKPPEIEIGVDPAQKATAGMLNGILMKYGVQGFQKTFSDPALMQRSIAEVLPAVEQSTGMDPQMKEHYKGFLTGLDSFMGYLGSKKTTPPDTATNAGTPVGSIEPVVDINKSVDTARKTGDETTEKPSPTDIKSDEGGFSGFQPLVIRNKEIIRKKKGPSSGYAVSFPQGIMWGIIGCAATFGISIVVERSRGTLVRLRSAPVTLLQILAGKALACFLTTISISFGLILMARFIFGVIPNSFPLLIMAIVSICTGFVGIMMMLSVLGKTERSAGGIGWAFLMMMSMLGGGMIPLFVMPGWMQSLSTISPVKWSMLAMEGAIWRQFTFSEMLLPCGIIISVGVICFTIGVTLFQKTVQD